MGKKNKLKKPTLAGSKTVIGFSVVMLLLFVGMAYLASHIQPARSRRPDSPQIPIYFERAEDAMPFPARQNGRRNPRGNYSGSMGQRAEFSVVQKKLLVNLHRRRKMKTSLVILKL